MDETLQQLITRICVAAAKTAEAGGYHDWHADTISLGVKDTGQVVCWRAACTIWPTATVWMSLSVGNWPQPILERSDGERLEHDLVLSFVHKGGLSTRNFSRSKTKEWYDDSMVAS